MAEYSRIAKGRFTSTGAAQIINLPFAPDTVQMWNYTVANTAATSQNVAAAYWDINLGQGFAIQQGYDTTPKFIYDSVIANGITTFSAGQLLQFGPTLSISGITKASPAVVTTTAVHNLASGDVVIFAGLFQSTTPTGMPQINGLPFTVTVTGTTTFTIPWNTNQSNYTALSGSPSTATVKKVLYPYLYFPGQSFITNITLSTGGNGTTTIDTTSAHNFRVGQEVAFRIPSQWGTTQLNSLPNSTIPGQPLYGYVTSVTDYNTVIVNIDSSAYTAFSSNPTAASVPGLSYPQIVAVGGVNTGGNLITASTSLYPPPVYEPIGTTEVNTINGPAIRGAFVNNTAQGFVIGNGAGTVLTTSKLCGATSDVIIWEAKLHDMSLP